jgi:hypothetical protein
LYRSSPLGCSFFFTAFVSDFSDAAMYLPPFFTLDLDKRWASAWGQHAPLHHVECDAIVTNGPILTETMTK